MFLLLRRGTVRGLLNLLRERRWGSSLGALFGVFVLVQLLVLVLMGLQGMQSILRNRTDLRLEMRLDATDADIQDFNSALEQLPIVRDTVFITKEKAYEQTKQSDPELITFLEEFKIQNPFADTIGVTLRSLDDYDTFKAFVQESQWQNIVNPTFLSDVTNQEQHVFALLNITRAARTLTMIILGITVLALLFVTTELIRHRAASRSDEVLVERLVGATPASIALPFVIEAIVLLLIAIVLSVIVLLALIFLLPFVIPDLQMGGALVELRTQVTPLISTVLPLWVLLEILATPLLGAFGAWLGVHRQIQSPRIAYAL